MKGVIYARYSAGPKQTDQSIEGQVKDCKKYALENGIEIIDIYADRHISGTTVVGRTEFLRMLSDAKDKLFDCIVVWKVDRFGRDRTDIALGKHELKKAGVKLMYAKESIPEGPEGIILEAMLEGMAEYYSADLRQKVKRGLRDSAAKGKICSVHLPIGYKNSEDGIAMIDPVAADAVREAFRMHINGHTAEEIADMMNERGVISPKGHHITNKIVRKMLRNEKYRGTWEVYGVTMTLEPIIDIDTFEEAQLCMGKTRNSGSYKAKFKYLLTGKCVCGYCGSPIVGDSGRSHTGKFYQYYNCSRKKKKASACEFEPAPRSYIEEVVVAETMEKILTDEMINFLCDQIMEIQEEELALEDVTVELNKQLSDVNKRKNNLIKVLEVSPSTSIIERIHDLETEAEELEINIAKATSAREIVPREFIYDWLSSFKKGKKKDLDLQERIIETFISKVTIKNDAIVILYNLNSKNLDKGSDSNPIVKYRSLNPNLIIFGNYIQLSVAL